MKIVAVSASMSESSSSTALGERVLRAVRKRAEESGTEAQVSTVSLRDLAHDLVDMTLTGMPTPRLEEAFAEIESADAVVAITPVYNAAPVGIFTLFWQLFPEGGLQGKPVLLAATGGTARHSLVLDSQVRPVIAYLKGIVLPTTVYAATEDWGAGGGAGSPNARAEAGAAELMGLVCSIRTGVGGPDRAAAAPGTDAEVAEPHRRPDEFDPAQVTPFEQLLNMG
ncbi:flavoprotein [Brevibacterium sp. 5221]|uniref:Flavoprotein n=1 Tax=Brevibacterium rongguiense TaxID=2695267 RepID=A0A6N9H8J5_9MICO|nr:CE1759 family FMN reductase [Brevibacterium rongguiense]MYM19884.1 flavoprotein [Brevibacterium rongguiense]